MIPIIILLLKIIIVVTLVLYCLDWAGFRPFRRGARNSGNFFSGFKNWQDEMQSGGLRSKLLKRVDKATAERLINAARFKTPGKSERWYLEKVIYDLERGR